MVVGIARRHSRSLIMIAVLHISAYTRKHTGPNVDQLLWVRINPTSGRRDLAINGRNGLKAEKYP